MVGWQYRLDGHKFEQALGVGEGQRSLACCRPWGHKGLDMTERLNNKSSCNFGMPIRSDQIRSVAQSCPTLCDPMNLSMPGMPMVGGKLGVFLL